MPGAVTFLEWSLTGSLTVLAGVLFYALVTGRIPVNGILHETEGGGILADRVQMLAMSLGGAGAYFVYALQHVGEPRLPEIPAAYLVLAGASQGLYLATKFVRRRLGRL